MYLDFSSYFGVKEDLKEGIGTLMIED